MSKLGLSSYASPPPNRPASPFVALVPSWFVPLSSTGVKISVPTPASTNGLYRLNVMPKTYAPVTSCSREWIRDLYAFPTIYFWLSWVKL